jgi:adenylate kinase
MLRLAVEQKTDIGQHVEKRMASGDLVPDKLIVDMVAQRIKESDCVSGAILDGFPRTLAQAKMFDNVLSERDLVLDLVILFEANDEMIIDRIAGRFSCADCGESYHDTNRPLIRDGICDVCGGARFRRRADDNPETIRHRLNDYHVVIEPLLQFFRAKYILKSVDAVAEIGDLKYEIESLMNIS